jgi:hypothetical protein
MQDENPHLPDSLIDIETFKLNPITRGFYYKSYMYLRL